jgi:hypothetical protein
MTMNDFVRYDIYRECPIFVPFDKFEKICAQQIFQMSGTVSNGTNTDQDI